eukprot:TRINITY_DN3337_c0_g1_i1.p1 TRINITY_DN3337_c0_g1~~TRINITY_DN3337_c0_g1_i1.p1  ORF type:complete len:337 (+),score=132.40 TRINITY_DN3337_c0_g1_i1:53-1063(+)
MTEYDDLLATSVGYDSDSSDGDTDEELKEAFAAGLLKPGLNVIGEAPEKKVAKNNVAAMRQKLAEMQKNLPWIERLDLVNAPAPLAPELAFKEDLHGKERATRLQQEKAGITLEKDEVHNDFKREMMFYRQAQAAVLEAIPRLHSMNIRTKRPVDYFAQMAKTDEHMNKIRTKLLSKEQGQERAEKMSKLRELKKYGKKVQVEVQQKRLKEKKDMMDEMKKIRKGQGGGNMDFLENGGGKGESNKGGGRADKENKNAVAGKRNAKDKKFGYGGKKRNIKKNDKNSTDDVSGFKPFNKGGAGGSKSGAKGGKKLGKGAIKRPGKGNRQKMKNHNKKK